jgi:hypothetical protein
MFAFFPIAICMTQAVLSTPTLESKVASVLPTPQEERWLQIPWRTNLMRARSESQQAGKPLFLWIMDGHPLGCT